MPAQVDGLDVPAGVGEGDGVAPHERAVRAQTVDEEGVPRRARVAPTEAGEGDG